MQNTSTSTDQSLDHRLYQNKHNKTTTTDTKYINKNISVNIEPSIKSNSRKRNLINTHYTTQPKHENEMNEYYTYSPAFKRQKLSSIQDNISSIKPSSNNHQTNINNSTFMNCTNESIQTQYNNNNETLTDTYNELIKTNIPRLKSMGNNNKTNQRYPMPINERYNYYITFGENTKIQKPMNKLETLNDFSNLVKEQTNKFHNNITSNELNIEPIRHSFYESYKLFKQLLHKNNRKRIKPVAVLAGKIARTSSANIRDHRNYSNCASMVGKEYYQNYNSKPYDNTRNETDNNNNTKGIETDSDTSIENIEYINNKYESVGCDSYM